MQITVVRLHIAKHVFQAHAADADGRAVAQVKLRRAQVLDYFRGLPPYLGQRERFGAGVLPDPVTNSPMIGARNPFGTLGY